MKVMVQTIHTPTGLSTIHSLIKVIDWNNSSDRKWLTQHMHWAMNNDREVRIKESNLTGIAANFTIIDETCI